MKLRPIPVAVALAASMAVAMPALADSGHGKGHDKGHGKKWSKHEQQHVRRDDDRYHGGPVYARNCPPGLAKKTPACVPPGQVGKSYPGDGWRVGDVFRVGDYRVIRDPRLYDLQMRDNWRYYRDGDRAYRVDSSTQKILAVINLVNAFSN